MSDQPLSMSMFASSADYWRAMYEASRAEVDGLRTDFATGTDALGAEIERLRAKVKELALQALSDSGQAIDALNSVAELRSALSGLFNNSVRADWPDDLYDAAELALKNSARAADAAIR